MYGEEVVEHYYADKRWVIHRCMGKRWLKTVMQTRGGLYTYVWRRGG